MVLRAGRLLPSTKLQNLMHEFLTAKHGLQLEPATLMQTKITYAKLFERFKKVAGMTGTAKESANAFWESYRLSVRFYQHSYTYSKPLGCSMQPKPTFNTYSVP